MLIYRLVSPSGKSYIGQTKQDLETRFKQHLIAWQGKKVRSKLYLAFDKYPPENWSKEILCECLTREEANKNEILYIRIYDTIDNGYNTAHGGSVINYGALSSEHKENIRNGRINWLRSEDGQRYKKLMKIKSKGNKSNLGRIPWNKGKRYSLNLSDEARRRRSERSKRTSSDYLRKAWAEGKFKNRKKPSPETYKRMGQMRKGFKQSERQKELVRAKLSKTWEIMEPDGKVVIVTNLNQYAAERGLHSGNLGRTAGTKYKAKGYRVIRKLE